VYLLTSEPASQDGCRLSVQDQEILIKAYECLEHPSFAARLSNLVGTPIEVATQLLPSRWAKKAQRWSEKALESALTLALRGLDAEVDAAPADHRKHYRWIGGMSGALGGLLGAPAMVVELPVMTVLMMRSIAEIARASGESLDRLETRLACLEVFALGGPSQVDDASETGYYGLRLSLEVPIAQAAHFLAKPRPGAHAPVLVKLMQTVSERFGFALSQKAMALTIPVIGAGSAALINVAFMQHFQDIAKSHFAIRGLERTYGSELIQQEYEALKVQQPDTLSVFGLSLSGKTKTQSHTRFF
jgi:hypothetical protein